MTHKEIVYKSFIYIPPDKYYQVPYDMDYTGKKFILY